MWPDQPYAGPRSSFARPVPLVEHDASDTPTKTVALSCYWLPYVRGALQQLLLQSTWATDDAAALLLQQQRVFNLIDLFGECSSADLPFACPYDWETASPEGWSAPSWLTPFGYVPGSLGVFGGSGLGWDNTDAVSASGPRQVRGITIDHDYSPDINVRTVDFDYDLLLGTATDCPGGLNFGVELQNGAGVALADVAYPFCTVAVGAQTFHADFGSLITGVARVRLFAWSDSLPNLSGTMDGAVHIFSCTVSGNGIATC